MPTLFLGKDEKALRQLQNDWCPEGAPDNGTTTLLLLDAELLERDRGLDAYQHVCDWLDSWLKNLGGGGYRELRIVLANIQPVALSAVE
ncbi:MAG TPA: hypothetical protein VD926_04840, partial [Acidimicrobiales bacterium]|nr:hypothetical protein [Acidimicrobiales bacterium]